MTADFREQSEIWSGVQNTRCQGKSFPPPSSRNVQLNDMRVAGTSEWREHYSEGTVADVRIAARHALYERANAPDVRNGGLHRSIAITRWMSA